jgi:tellurite resistance protein TehA-like permease
MLIAAMILGLIGGITYFVGGCTGAISWTDGTAPWWVVSLIPIGVLGAMGAALARTKPSVAGMIMLLAAAGALGVGLASYSAYDAYVVDRTLARDILLPVHPFMGSVMYAPVPLLTLIIGGMLALSSGKKTGAED